MLDRQGSNGTAIPPLLARFDVIGRLSPTRTCLHAYSAELLTCETGKIGAIGSARGKLQFHQPRLDTAPNPL